LPKGAGMEGQLIQRLYCYMSTRGTSSQYGNLGNDTLNIIDVSFDH
jgi:hypothetical protein